MKKALSILDRSNKRVSSSPLCYYCYCLCLNSHLARGHIVCARGYVCIEQGSTTFIYKYFQLFRLYHLCCNYSTLPLQYENIYSQYVNQWVWPHSNKTLFTNSGPDSDHSCPLTNPGRKSFLQAYKQWCSGWPSNQQHQHYLGNC